MSKKKVILVASTSLIIGTWFGIGIGSNDYSSKVQIPQAVQAILPSSNVVLASQNNNLQNLSISASPAIPVAKKLLPSIVAISVIGSEQNYFGRSYQTEGTGSGIIIDSSKGYIVTNNHVIEGASQITVILNSGKKLSASLVGRDSQTDLAVIKVSGSNLTAAKLGDSSKLQVGELAIAIGSPMGTEYAGSVTSGIISGLNRKVSVGDKNMNLIQTDAAINPGNSGGALVDPNGEVIGINSLKLVEDTAEGMGFAIPINEAKPIIQELIKNKKISRPSLGISGEDITQEIADAYDVPVGVHVLQTVANSGAQSAGLNTYSIITKVDGKVVKTTDELANIVSKHKIGDTVKIEVYNVKIKAKTTISIKLIEG
jgi:serine protease Do